MWDYSDKVINVFYHPHNIGAIAPYECLEGEAIAIGDLKRLMYGRDTSHLYQ